MRYRLVSDNDGHDYVIPADRADDWGSFLNSSAYEDGRELAWAKRLPGSSWSLTFEAPRWNEVDMS